MEIAEILSLLWKYKTWVAIGLLMAVIGGQRVEVSHLQAKIAKREGLISDLKTQNLAFAESVAKQDLAIKNLENEAKSREIAAKIAIKGADDARKRHEKAAYRLETEKLTGSECDQSNELLDKYLKGAFSR